MEVCLAHNSQALPLKSDAIAKGIPQRVSSPLRATQACRSPSPQHTTEAGGRRRRLSTVELEELEIEEKRKQVQTMMRRNRRYMEKNHANLKAAADLSASAETSTGTTSAGTTPSMCTSTPSSTRPPSPLSATMPVIRSASSSPARRHSQRQSEDQKRAWSPGNRYAKDLLGVPRPLAVPRSWEPVAPAPTKEKPARAASPAQRQAQATTQKCKPSPPRSARTASDAPASSVQMASNRERAQNVHTTKPKRLASPQKSDVVSAARRAPSPQDRAQAKPAAGATTKVQPQQQRQSSPQGAASKSRPSSPFRLTSERSQVRRISSPKTQGIHCNVPQVQPVEAAPAFENKAKANADSVPEDDPAPKLNRSCALAAIPVFDSEKMEVVVPEPDAEEPPAEVIPAHERGLRRRRGTPAHPPQGALIMAMPNPSPTFASLPVAEGCDAVINSVSCCPTSVEVAPAPEELPTTSTSSPLAARALREVQVSTHTSASSPSNAIKVEKPMLPPAAAASTEESEENQPRRRSLNRSPQAVAAVTAAVQAATAQVASVVSSSPWSAHIRAQSLESRVAGPRSRRLSDGPNFTQEVLEAHQMMRDAAYRPGPSRGMLGAVKCVSNRSRSAGAPNTRFIADASPVEESPRIPRSLCTQLMHL